MRSSHLQAAMLMSALAIAHANAGAGPGSMGLMPAPSPRPHPKVDREKLTAQQREIADWNADVDRRKAEKKGRRHE